MREKIALGVHVCVDWECIWDEDIFCSLVKDYAIRKEELRQYERIHTERELLISILYLMQQNAGGEVFPEDTSIVENIAGKFPYHTTLGGTATRAAILLAKLGRSSVLQMCTDNSTIRELLPPQIHGICANENCANRIYPHASITYPKHAHIVAGDIDFVTARENRVLFSMDTDSENMFIDENFGSYLTDAKVFLLGCLGEVLDEEVLKDRVKRACRFLAEMPKDGVVLFEDGGYPAHEKRVYVHEQLRDYVDIVSMNEDELQEYVGFRFDLKDPQQVLAAVEQIYDALKVPSLIIHSSAWALAYGEHASKYRVVLESGITAAETRFCFGDEIDQEKFEETRQFSYQEDGCRFAEEIEKLSDQICCVPCRDLSFVKNPTVVGLGDTFAGGMVLALADL